MRLHVSLNTSGNTPPTPTATRLLTRGNVPPTPTGHRACHCRCRRGRAAMLATAPLSRKEDRRAYHCRFRGKRMRLPVSLDTSAVSSWRSIAWPRRQCARRPVTCWRSGQSCAGPSSWLAARRDEASRCPSPHLP
jgi:hypothetical protein